MGKYLPDPEIDRLVQEMNRSVKPDSENSPPLRTREEAELDGWGGSPTAAGGELLRLVAEMIHRNASDLVLVPGSAPVLRVNGRLERMEDRSIDKDAIRRLFESNIGHGAARRIAETGSADFSLSVPGEQALRLRVNIQRQSGLLAAAIRALPRSIPSLEALHLPSELVNLVDPSNGLVLVCGPTGSGKSTTIAALLDHVNRSQFRHVITIEEPIEYQHPNQRSVFEQIEVGSDSPSFADALRSALRRDPDIILVGEMRDLETMATAITAAETGHLILSTLHTSDVAQAVHRMIDVFPANQQAQISQQLSMSLSAIVCQQLVPTMDGGGRVPAVEVLRASYAVRNHVRRGHLDRLYDELVGGRSRGMVSMEQSLADLVRAGAINGEEARVRSSRPEEFERILGS